MSSEAAPKRRRPATRPGSPPFRARDNSMIAASDMRQAAGDHAFVELAAAGDAQPLVVEKGALAAFGDVEFVIGRIVDHAGDHVPSRCKPIEIANCGMPCRKLVVPSSGSTIQVWVLSLPSRVPPSSPMKP